MVSTFIYGVIVTYQDYYRCHNKQPKGYGRWCFRIGDNDLFFEGTYTQARNEAVKEAKKVGVQFIDTLG